MTPQSAARAFTGLDHNVLRGLRENMRRCANRGFKMQGF